jgi:hypothetical protein
LPRCFDPAPRFQAVERRIQRARFNLEKIFRSSLDVLGNGVPMRRPNEKRAKNQKIKSALEEFHASDGSPVHSVDSLDVFTRTSTGCTHVRRNRTVPARMRAIKRDRIAAR